MTKALAALLLLAAMASAQPDTALYYVSFLRPAADRPTLAKEDGERLQSAHMAHIRKMAADGYLVSAGPFDDTPTTISGIFIMKAVSIEEARRIANQDPTIAARRNTIDVHSWRGPKGIGDEYFRLHKADPKAPEGMGLHPVAFLRPGPGWKGNELEIDHVVNGLKANGKLVAGGRIEGEPDFKAILIFSRIPLKDAMQLMTTAAGDPFIPEFHQFYSAAHVFPWNQ